MLNYKYVLQSCHNQFRKPSSHVPYSSSIMSVTGKNHHWLKATNTSPYDTIEKHRVERE